MNKLIALIAALAVTGITFTSPAFGVSSATVGIEQGAARMYVGSGGSLDVESGGEIDIESGGSLKIAGTAISATASELNNRAVYAFFDRIDAATTTVIIAPAAGTISSIVYTVGGIPAGTTTAITAKVNGVSVTGGDGSFESNAEPYDKDTATPTANHTVAAGDMIEIGVDGSAGEPVGLGVLILIGM